MTKIYYKHRFDNIPYYIGKTRKTKLEYRYSLKQGRGVEFDLVLIDEVPDNEWRFWESYWIEQFKVWGFQLENKNNGGGGLDTHTEEVKERIRQKNSRPNPLISKQKKNHPCYSDPSFSKKISEGKQKSSFKYSDESKLKMRLSKLGTKVGPNTPEHAKKISEGKMGKGFKSIICTTLFGMEFANRKEAAEYLGVDKGKITLVLQSKIPHTQGFHFIRK
jgi:hypothetical protein